ncbi:MAG: hypothetical protein NWE94_06030 [Candidatus Bathyarchaeota archaeon]|nr:hypothetical protein [Candidatus Bathyarchaeota archaeon]
MSSQTELEETLRRAIARYNRFRSPEAIAKLVRVSPDSVTIAFSGAFCSSCSVIGYVEAFIHDFETLTDKVKLKIDKTRQMSPRSIEADYKIKNERQARA